MLSDTHTQALNDILKKLSGGKIGVIDVTATTQPGFPITESLRAKILGEGLALFQLQKGYYESHEDPYRALETRPDTTEAQRKTGRDALADAERRIFGRSRVGGDSPTLLDSAKSSESRASGGTSLVGLLIYGKSCILWII